MNVFIDKAAQEVLELHERLAAWIRGDSSAKQQELDALLARFHPDFLLIAPMGRKQGRTGVAELLEASHGCKTELDISIFDLELLHAAPDVAIFTYEEQRRCEHSFHRRISTAVFTPGPDGAPLWRHLHETWIEDND